MRTMRVVSLLVVVMLLATLLAACGGAAAPTAAPTAAPATKAPDPTKPPEPTAAPIELMKVSAPDCAYGGAFKSIEAVDANTVKFTLCAPDVAFPSKVAFSAFAIHSSDYLAKTGGTGDLLDKPVGTGPYMLDKWQKGDSVIMKANPNYWGDKAQSPTLVFRWQKEAAARLLELQAGTTDGIDNPGPDDFKTIEGDSALKLYPREALNVFYLGFSNLVKPFDNEMVRQAVAMGIDRQRIVDNFYPAGSVVASHFTPCAIPGGCDGEEWYKFDAAAAKKMLADAGFPNGFETELSYRDVVRGYLPQPALVAQDLQAQFAFLLEGRDKLTQAHEAILKTRAIRDQVGGVAKKAEGDALAELRTLGDKIKADVTAIEETLYQTKNKSGQDPLNFPIRLNDKLGNVLSVVSAGDNAPTQQAVAVKAELTAAIDAQIDKLNALVSLDLSKLNRLAAEAGIPHVLVEEKAK